MEKELINTIQFHQDGLVPVVAQEANSKEVLMLAYMNKEALSKTLETGLATYYSRSRQALWVKGETSGHKQEVVSLKYDCDEDAILLLVNQTGPACHTNQVSCFYREVSLNQPRKSYSLEGLYQTIMSRKNKPEKKSYTNYLFQEGIDKILKKIGEETSEIIIAAKNPSKDELIYELSDFVYHALVLMAEKGLVIGDIYKELEKRSK